MAAKTELLKNFEDFSPLNLKNDMIITLIPVYWLRDLVIYLNIKNGKSKMVAKTGFQ